MSKKAAAKSETCEQRAPLVDLFIPQMGEGLREVHILKLLKQPGDKIKQDEVLYEIETDKATTEIESPYAGKLVEWQAAEGEVLPIGSCIAKIEIVPSSLENSLEGLLQVPVQPDLPKKSSIENGASLSHFISPRVRNYCKQKNISSESMLQIPVSSKRLTIEDVDKHLEFLIKTPQDTEPYRIIQLSSSQQRLNYRFKHSAESVISANLVSLIDLSQLNNAMRKLLADNPQKLISEFQVFSYIVAKASVAFPKFRSLLVDNKTIHEYKHINLGIAVQTVEKELVTAVIPAADKLDFNSFLNTMQIHIKRALNGEDQATEYPPNIILSYMGDNQIIFGAPVLVSPAVAILFLGAVLPYENKRLAYLSLTFDHRVINGMDATQFLEAITVEIHNNTNIKQANEKKLPTNLQPLNENSKDPKVFKSWLLNTLGDLLGIDSQQIDLEEPLGLQGMDSIKAVKLSSLLENYFNTSIPKTLLWQHPSFEEMFGYLAHRFCENTAEEKVPAPAENLSEILKNLKNLPAEELKEIFDKALLDENS